uniref:Uncharacterized protein n=1 Tax=viral metagenome TaxID=1070528 RepID=A0A6H2A281_9ZZZZ
MKKERTIGSYKFEIRKLKNLLWDCYVNLHDLYGADENDFLVGHEERLTFSEAKRNSERLKKEIKRVIE